MKKYWVLVFLLTSAGCDRPEPMADGEPPIRFIALDMAGAPSVDNTALACIRDVRTGLVWERKSDSDGLHGWRNTYSWFDPDEAHDELDYRGTANGGNCNSDQCDTLHAVMETNAEKLCGYDDWRMPSRDELFSISDLGKAKTPPTIDTDFFPFTQAAEYWTANDYSFQPDSAWAWNYEYGHDRVDWKKTPKYVRLVRGNAIDLTQVKE